MRHHSVWTATADLPSFPALDDDIGADLVVVGGGIVGLTTALLATQAGLSRVVVLEARTLGSGTTGSTTGKVSTQHGLTYASLRRRLGDEAATWYAAANQAGMDKVVDLVEEFGIECDLTRAPSYLYTQESSRRKDLVAEAEAANQAGLAAEVVTETDLPYAVASAVRFPDQVHFHPAKYLAGLANAFVAAGGLIYENSRVVRYHERSGRVHVRTARGTIRAQNALLATLLPPGLTGGFFARAKPVRSYAFAVRLREQAPVSMSLSIDQPTRSIRPWLAPDGGNGLIIGGNGHQTGDSTDYAAAYEDLQRWAENTFDVDSCEFRWSAQDYQTFDQVPYVGRVPLHKSLYVATGFRKWGLSNGTAAALMVLDEMLGRSNPWQKVFDTGRIGDTRAVVQAAEHNLKSGVELTGGHLMRALRSPDPELKPGEGGIVKLKGDTVGAYRDPDGRLHVVKPTCTHLGCPLTWNGAETSWDCSCHGSRFTADGDILEGPAKTPLSRPHD
ncbi:MULTISPECIES: FAD-dependent oxidoreductase [Thermocrispum]|jgi:glycine/D-amino acid oxidase-like deaminating enzyme/nitrite reductase/ring-hydroxylating ferredoxin subunit|uniref:FAD-dependent oxidoreductase n=1 Tax=Thermocrispum agreste TaxID=37925 RepID=A0ABD6FEJ4_9PSEU|nr:MULTISPECIES: FAD-dependent oxidoreductase [Thermocrispum]